MPRDIAGRGYSRMPFVPGSRNEGSSDRDWKQYIYIKYFSDVFLQAVGAYFPCIQIQKLTGDLMAQTSKCEYPVQTFCRLLTMKSNSTDLQRIFRVIGQGCVARNGIASIQFVFYYDLSSASADIKARRMGEYFIFLCK